MTQDQEFARSLHEIESPSIAVAHRVIAIGDEHALLPEEANSFERYGVRARRASGAARIVARALLHGLGKEIAALPKSSDGVPIWPKGSLGSLAHDSRVAVAAASASRYLAGLGIDVEPAEDLPADLISLVTTPRERANLRSDPFRGRLLFVAKEAAYKAVYPLDQLLLGHHDIEVDLANRRAIFRNGRVVHLRFSISKHLVALALLLSR
ncbi:4'-phosphopantetheinyl transferase superfamily protein [Bradyrhizobium canariense]|uniref:4'-phosphopantetheinyl transferase superfamily protein n=1 Tax=Bradyrhizobium canariense TaxID=255045 RepID=UPI001CA578D5|nr:4'-phosphopantetheinyl transferase superfamily protein [Bradyrhizobium canariense]MBW5438036.1 4'-phosphopantetheinyl transferase superfamily protein [Bradyrhizobium canariense]